MASHSRSLCIFFSGHISGIEQSGWQRAMTFESLGHRVIRFNQDDYVSRIGRAMRKLRSLAGAFPFDSETEAAYNQDLLVRLSEVDPDVIWFEKSLLLTPDTLRMISERFPRARKVSFQDDDPFGHRLNERPGWKNFISAIPEMDVHVLKKDIDLAEFKEKGAKRVEPFFHGYYEPLFSQALRDPEAAARTQAIFVGTPLDHRVKFLAKLLRLRPRKVEIYGNDWHKTLPYHLHRSQFHPAIVGERYAHLIANAKISLGFVSHSNRDQFSMRTFEVPGAGGFLLAERTQKHLQFYEEGKEAEFFSSVEECAEKIDFYLRNEEARVKIAEAGRRRAERDGYGLQPQLGGLVERIIDGNSPG